MRSRTSSFDPPRCHATDAAGNVIFEVHDSVIEKSNADGRPGAPLLCTFAFQILHADGNTSSVWGDTDGFLTPAP